MAQIQTEGADACIVRKESMHRTILRLLVAVGLPEEDAEYVADSMVLAHLRGVDTHGIRSLPNYINRYRVGSLNKTPKITIEKETEVSALVHGDNGLGHVVGAKAMKIAIQKAQKSGVGMVALHHTNHFGAAAYFSMMAQRAGLIGFSVTNATPRMAPTGGKSMIYGNNPWSVAFPYNEGEIPIVIDMANSVVANSNINIARKLGKKIPTTWALTKDGQPTDDPNLAVLLQPFGGYKGYAISVVAEVLSAILSGANVGGAAGAFNTENPEGQNIGQFYMAIAPDIFIGTEKFKTDLKHFADELKSSELAEGSKGVFLPGEMEYLRLCARTEEGIPVSPAFIADLALLCQEYSVPCEL